MLTLAVQVEIKLSFWGADLAKCREELGLSEREFAEKCGWSQSNQAQLELPGIKHTLDFKKRQKFYKLGIKFKSKRI